MKPEKARKLIAKLESLASNNSNDHERVAALNQAAKIRDKYGFVSVLPTPVVIDTPDTPSVETPENSGPLNTDPNIRDPNNWYAPYEHAPRRKRSRGFLPSDTAEYRRYLRVFVFRGQITQEEADELFEARDDQWRLVVSRLYRESHWRHE